MDRKYFKTNHMDTTEEVSELVFINSDTCADILDCHFDFCSIE